MKKSDLQKLSADLDRREKDISDGWRELSSAQNNLRLREESIKDREDKSSEKEILLSATEISLSLREKNLAEAISVHEVSIELLNKARSLFSRDSEEIDKKNSNLVEREKSLAVSIKNVQDKESSLNIKERAFEIDKRDVQTRLVLAQNLEQKILKGANT